MTTITIDTASYNQRRYGKPWIAKVDFAADPKGNFEFGDWSGDHYNGGAGVLTIDAEPGDIIATGQKDNRQARNSAPDYYLVQTDGQLATLGDKGAAYKHYLAHKDQSAAPAAEAAIDPSLIAELMQAWNKIMAAAREQHPDASEEDLYTMAKSAMDKAIGR